MSSMVRSRAPVRCSVCRQTGHNKRRCPELSTHQDSPAVAPTPVPDQEPKAVETDSCPICMDDLDETNCCTTPCGHKFCLGCYVKHTSTKSTCPMCRADIPCYGGQRAPSRVALPTPRSRHRAPSPTLFQRLPTTRAECLFAQLPNLLQSYSNDIDTRMLGWLQTANRDPPGTALEFFGRF
jgi:hypothetical protein